MRPTACYCGMRRDAALLRLADEIDTISLGYVDGLAPLPLARHYAGADWEELLKRGYDLPVAFEKAKRRIEPEMPMILKALGLKCERCGRTSLDFDAEEGLLFCCGEPHWGGELYVGEGCAAVQKQPVPAMIWRIYYACQRC